MMHPADQLTKYLVKHVGKVTYHVDQASPDKIFSFNRPDPHVIADIWDKDFTHLHKDCRGGLDSTKKNFVLTTLPD